MDPSKYLTSIHSITGNTNTNGVIKFILFFNLLFSLSDFRHSSKLVQIDLLFLLTAYYGFSSTDLA